MTTTTTPLQLVAARVDGSIEADQPGEPQFPGALSARPHLALTAVAADVGAILLVASLVGWLTGPDWPPGLALALVPAWLLAVAMCGGLRPSVGGSTVRPLLRAAGVLGLVSCAAIAVAPGLVGHDAGSSARAIVAAMVLTPGLAAAFRALADRFGSSRTRPLRTVVVGDPGHVRVLLAEMDRRAAVGRRAFEPVAVCVAEADSWPYDPDADLTVWHGVDKVPDIVDAHGADAVVVVPGPDLGHAELRRLGAQLQSAGAELLVSCGLRDVAPGRMNLTTAGGMRLLHVRPAPLAGPARSLKELADRSVAAVLLVLLAPLLGVLALVVRIDSPGPAFFRQVRVGRGGKPFTVFKLRTMQLGADDRAPDLAEANECDRAGVLFKIKSDPRLTRLGSILRKYSLDELPQLLNAVRGDMSLVGPRPALPQEVNRYSEDLRRRLDVKPGITGLWQVSGRSDLTWEETVRLDLAYVDNWSWALDLRIAVRTVAAVIGHRGAY